jgi:hypothetical protein
MNQVGGTSAHCEHVLSNGGLELFQQHLKSENQAVRELVIQAVEQKNKKNSAQCDDLSVCSHASFAFFFPLVWQHRRRIDGTAQSGDSNRASRCATCDRRSSRAGQRSGLCSLVSVQHVSRRSAARVEAGADGVTCIVQTAAHLRTEGRLGVRVRVPALFLLLEHRAARQDSGRHTSGRRAQTRRAART